MKKLIIPLCLTSILMLACKSNKITSIKVTKLVETSKSWNGEPLPKYLDGKPKVTLLKIIIPPKTKLDVHKHSEINVGYLLKGELTVISEANDTLHLKAGEPLVELVNTWHYGINQSNKPAEIIVFYAGVEGTPITVLKKEIE